MLGSIIKQERLKQDMKQSVLCHGICSVSYLSKIENEQADANEDVIYLLFKKLGFEYKMEYDHKAFDTLCKDIETYILFQEQSDKKTQEYLEQLQPYTYSSQYWNVFLNRLILSQFSYLPFELPQSLPPHIENHPYVAIYYSSYHVTDDVVGLAIEKLKLAQGNDTTGLVAIKLSESYFYAGNFSASIEHAKEALSIAASMGNARLMLWAHFRLSNSYVYYDFDVALQHFQASWRLNELVKDEALGQVIDYNLGSDYLDHFFNTESKDNLVLAQKYIGIAYPNNEFEWIDGFEKSILIHLYLEDLDIVQDLFDTLSKKDEWKDLPEYKALAYAVNHPQFYLDKEYAGFVEVMYQESKKSRIHSRTIFIRNMLSFIYRKQKRYKKALDLLNFPN